MYVVSVSYLWNEILYHAGSNQKWSKPACPTQSVVKQPSESKAKIFCHTVPMQHIVLRNSPCSVIACVVRFLCPPSRLAGIGTCSGLQASGLAASFNGGKTTK
jgi:hypothetical protein